MAEFLVLSPHIDDEALGCGGVIDDRFHVHYCGVEAFREVNREVRLSEASACSQHLGFSYTVNLDNEVNAYQLPGLIGQFESVIAEVRPHTLFIPYPSYNQDHQSVFDAALVAVRPHDRNHFVSNVIAYEQIQVTIWPYREDAVGGRCFSPQFFVPIDVERKLAAYRCHASQVRAMRSEEMVSQVARWRGSQSGTPCAEAFMVLRLCDPTLLRLGQLRGEPQ